jgi:hypothetical protein
MAADPKTVCVPCRRVFKGEGRESMTESQFLASGRRQWPLKWMGVGSSIHVAPRSCPECGKDDLLTVSWRWRPPKRTNDRAWKRIASGDLLWESDPKDFAPKNEPNPNWKPGQSVTTCGRLTFPARRRS